MPAAWIARPGCWTMSVAARSGRLERPPPRPGRRRLCSVTWPSGSPRGNAMICQAAVDQDPPWNGIPAPGNDLTARVDWADAETQLDGQGWVVLPGLLDGPEADRIAGLYGR